VYADKDADKQRKTNAAFQRKAMNAAKKTLMCTEEGLAKGDERRNRTKHCETLLPTDERPI